MKTVFRGGSVSKTGTFSLLRTAGTPLLWYHLGTIPVPCHLHTLPLPVLEVFGVSRTLWPGSDINQLSL